MRSLTDHRFEEGGFEDAVRSYLGPGMMSLIIHAIVAVILWNVPFQIKQLTPVAKLEAPTPEMDEEVEDEPPDEPPEEPEEVVEEEPIETEEEAVEDEVDVDMDNTDTMGEEGLSDAPFTGPSTNSAIGLGGGAGGGRGGLGGRRNRKAKGGSAMTENAVELGLKWLADHQDVDGLGMWDCDELMKHDPADDKCDGPG
ncbi:MAG: hypothetical protein ACE5JG_05905, partial [Planctomycetota bacterium]